MLDSQTKLAGLVGWPVGHSLSPSMHNAAFDALGLNWRYLPFPVAPEYFSQALAGLPALGIHGVNFTIPYKQAVLPYLDTIDPMAKMLGAVNTLKIYYQSGKNPVLHGTNTDLNGFISALKQGGFNDINGKRAMVIGSGGAARAVVHGLIREGIREITILNRSIDRAQRLVNDFTGLCHKLTAYPLDEQHLILQAEKSDLMVNTTPMGTWPETDASIWPEEVPMPSQITVFDLVYNPRKTKLLRQAEKSHAKPISGLEMLVQQGGQAFELWTGLPAPLEVMRKTCMMIIGE